MPEEKITYLRKFLAEFHQKIPHRGEENNENFLDDVVRNGEGSYRFSVHEGKMLQWFDGDIYVSFGQVTVNICCESFILSGDAFSRELSEIAARTGVTICYTVNNKITRSGPSALGFVNIPLFRQDGSRLTVDQFVTDYLFNVSRAAREARQLEEHVYPELFASLR